MCRFAKRPATLRASAVPVVLALLSFGHRLAACHGMAIHGAGQQFFQIV